MPASFLERHRTICDTIEEIKVLAQRDGRHDIIALCEEAQGYGRSMSAKLAEYKRLDEESR